MNKLTLLIVYTSNHLASLRKSALIQKPSAKISKDLNQHGIADQTKKIRYKYFNTANWILACNFQSCKKTHLLSHAIRKLRRNCEVSWFLPHTLPPKSLGRIFSKNKLSMEDFLDKFMRGGKFKSYPIVCWWRCGELFWPGHKSAEEVCLERFRERLNCLWYLAVVVIFMGLGGAKSLVGLGGNDPSRHHGSD